MPPDSPAAVAGQPYKGVYEVHLGRDGVVSEFKLEGQGWTVQSFEPPAQGAMAGPGVVRIPFTATPTDPGQLLRLSLRFDGRPVSRSLRLGSAAFALRGQAQTVIQTVPGTSADKPAAREPESESPPAPAGSSSQTLRFQGRIVYSRPTSFNSDGTPIWFNFTDEGVHGIWVEVMDQDDVTADETIWSGYTDKDGYFDSGSIQWDDCDILGCDEPDIYLRWECDTPIVNVQDFEDILEADFSWSTESTQIWHNFTGSQLDFGTWKPADVNLMAPLHIHNSITRAHRFLTTQVGVSLNLPEVDVLWPDDGGNAYYTGEIFISPRREWNEGTHIHEYGHHLLHHNSANVPPDYCQGLNFCDGIGPCTAGTDCENPGHCQWCPETDHDAWNEGFPNWMADIVIRDFSWSYTFSDGSPYEALFPRDQEDLGVCCQDGQTHSPWITEGYVGALLRDIEDYTAFDGSSLQDDHDGDGIGDCLGLGFDEIFTIATVDDVTTPTGFLNAFIARYPQHIPGLYSTAYNVHPWYVTVFPPDTQPPGVVPYVSSPSHPPLAGGTSPCIELELGPVADDVTGACGFSYQWGTSPLGIEPDMDEEFDYVQASCCIVSTARSLGDHYVSLRAKDCAGHWSSQWATFGPFKVTDCNGNGILDVCEVAPTVNGQVCNASVYGTAGALACTPSPAFCSTLYPGVCGQAPDCNGNLIPDECDIASGYSQDCNLDGIPDECQDMVRWVAGSGSWHTPSNWDSDAVPQTGQYVCINVPDDDVTVSYTSGTTHLASLACHESLGLVSSPPPAHVLTLQETSFVLGNLTVGGRNTNTLSNANTLTVSGLFSIVPPADGGGHYWLRGPGAIVANGGMSVTRAAMLLDPGKAIYLANNSTGTATNIIEFNAASTSLRVQPGSTYICNGNFTAFSGSNGLFLNEGTFRRAGGTGDLTIGCPLQNPGEIRTETGTLRLSSGHSSTGQFIGDPGTTIDFRSGTQTLLPGSSLSADNFTCSGGTSNIRGSVNITGTLLIGALTFESAGTCTFTNEANVTNYGQHLNVVRGSVRFEAPKTGPPPLFDTVTLSQTTSGGKDARFNTGQPVSINTLNLVQGNIDGADPITINDAFTWGLGGGSILAGGAITCNGPATIQASSSNRALSRIFNNHGYATFLGGFSMGGGTFNNMPTGTIDIRDITTVFGLTTTATLHNHGLLVKTAGTGTSTISNHFRNTGTVEIQTGTLQFTGSNNLTHIQTAGQTILNGGGLSVTGSTPYQVQGGELRGIGTVAAVVQNTGGAVAPGLSVGTLNIIGNYTHGADATLKIELGGLAAGSEHDQLTVSSTATLQGGTVDVVPFGGFIPQVGQQFVILTAGSVVGTLSSVTGPGAYTLAHNPTHVTLTVTQAPCAQLVGPDFDQDCDVDSADFEEFQQCASGPGISHAAGCESRDFDGDGDVDQSDFAVFHRCLSGEGVAAAPNCAN